MTDGNTVPTSPAAAPPQVAGAAEPKSPAPLKLAAVRSPLVTFSGVVLALVPWLFLVGVAVLGDPDLPLRRAFAGDVDAGVLGHVAFSLIVAVVPSLAGLAVVLRFPGWRFYSGTLGWLFIVFFFFELTSYLHQTARNFAGPADYGTVAIGASFALFGILLLMAKRDEPPAQPFGLVTPVGIAIALSALSWWVAALTMAVTSDTAQGFVIVGVVIAFIGTAIALRWPGWRIIAGCFAWFLIAVGIFGLLNALGQMTTSSVYRLWDNILMPALFALALAHFILWAKRREPKPKAREKAAR